MIFLVVRHLDYSTEQYVISAKAEIQFNKNRISYFMVLDSPTSRMTRGSLPRTSFGAGMTKERG